jgi:hypothetical protein
MGAITVAAFINPALAYAGGYSGILIGKLLIIKVLQVLLNNKDMLIELQECKFNIRMLVKLNEEK